MNKILLEMLVLSVVLLTITAYTLNPILFIMWVLESTATLYYAIAFKGMGCFIENMAQRIREDIRKRE